jgi:hypothetical protein
VQAHALLLCPILRKTWRQDETPCASTFGRAWSLDRETRRTSEGGSLLYAAVRLGPLPVSDPNIGGLTGGARGGDGAVGKTMLYWRADGSGTRALLAKSPAIVERASIRGRVLLGSAATPAQLQSRG